MPRTLHGHKISQDGRVVFGSLKRDEVIRKSPEAIEKAKLRRELRLQKRVNNLIKSYEGRGIKVVFGSQPETIVNDNAPKTP